MTDTQSGWDKFKNFVEPAFQVNYFNKIEQFYGGLMDLVDFIVDKTTNQGADIAIRALPIVSPIPNAISMYYVSQDTLGFGDYQALALAIGMELSLFGLFEIVVRMFDGYQRDKERYKIWFWLSVIVAGLTTAMIIVLVLWLETDHKILAMLPGFSAAGAIALILRRWDARNQKDEQAALAAALVAMTTERDQLLDELDLMYKNEDSFVDKFIETPVIETVKRHARQVVRSVKRSDKKPVKVNSQTRDTLLNILRKEYDGQPADALDKAALGHRLGIKRGTLNYHLDALERAQVITLNGTVKVN